MAQSPAHTRARIESKAEKADRTGSLSPEPGTPAAIGCDVNAVVIFLFAVGELLETVAAGRVNTVSPRR